MLNPSVLGYNVAHLIRHLRKRKRPLSKPLPEAERGFKTPPSLVGKGRVVSYSQRKIKTRYQSLSPTGGEEWK
jgi:hypothetical protein